ncbi:MAG TPA: Wzz/FepE/Etk N-terminal domain-containing protein [Flavobacteriales bacterium]|nr:Wzz/FepE/Etk N-terminal domain-containing protein [Flavobacteriales bacterium]HRN36842.1 Wzz/FepE/Etk N-terminal domain-containing protein [Flavobacteriales bacterium]HRO40588.1 Wzz/FepE/Etk N-terminal domain-containing protein [Flavobacteriales bacterium]HRP82603.1 Wzz/FepE/Etk N-terminal domain-containing protein [Flavobacteriales bacterium]HRQ85016.1 Wzz/FepE/Etk N-terminal domain-containing protein [Flavobacteriales bacterium]
MAQDPHSKDGNSFDLVLFLWGKRRFLLGMALLGLVGGIVAAFALTPRFRSEVILFPAITNSVSKALLNEQSTGRDDILALGDEEDAEQLLQILHSDQVRDRTAERFNLLDVYEIKPDSRHKRSELRDAYESHVKFEYTKFGSVRVEVMDKDPQRAADMANFMSMQVDSVWNEMAHERALKGYRIVKESVDELQAEIKLIGDSMEVLRSLGVQDYHTQSERYNEYLGAAIVKGDKRAIDEFERRFAILAKYGGAYVQLQDRQFNEIRRLSVLNMKLEQAKADLDSDLPHKFTVNEAYPADRKSFPVRWLVVAVSLVGTMALALVLLVAAENIRKIKAQHA